MKKYLKYKSSGIEWLGDIPEHWNVVKLKYFAYNLNRRRIPLEEQVRREMTIKEYDYYGATGIIDKVENYLFNETTILIAEDGANLLSRNLQLIYIATGKYWVNNHAHILKPMKNCDLNFLALCLNCFDYSNLLRGAAQPKLTKEDLMNIPLPIPPLPEQEAIIRFLDHKTSQIDRFVANRKKQIELLKEQKAVIINNAVTGKSKLGFIGLKDDRIAKDSKILESKNPTNPNADSWIGEVPKDWIVVKLKYILNISNGDGLLPEFIKEEGGFEVIGGNGILGYTNKFNVDGTTIVIGRVGAKCGNVHFFNRKIYVNDNAMIVKPLKDVNPEYLNLLLETMNLNNLSTSTAQPLLTSTVIKNQFAPIPALHEQQAIVDYIKTETTKIDLLISKYNKQITLMQEYRTALISQAVTGKIDVRDWKPKQEKGKRK